MSKQLTVVAAGASAGLQAFAASLLSKVAVKPVNADAIAANAVVIGAESPAGAHTCVTSGAGASGIYAGIKTTIVRAVLPKGDANTLPLRDAVDVLPSAGIDAAAEVAAARAAFAESAKVAVQVAKAAGEKKVTLVVKQQSKYAQLNDIFASVAKEVIEEGAGLATETLGTAQATNALVMFPETLGVVFTADTPAAESIEQAFAGVAGSLVRTFHAGNGVAASAGHSTTTVAKAVATSLKGLGLTAEAAKIEAALAKTSGTDGGKSLLAAL